MFDFPVFVDSHLDRINKVLWRYFLKILKKLYIQIKKYLIVVREFVLTYQA